MAARSCAKAFGAATTCLAGPSRLPLAPIFEASRPSSRSLSTSIPTWSGHNRWSKIRHKKGAADAAKSTRLNKLVQNIFKALSSGSTDPTVNARLALAVAKAKEGGATKANIESAFARARSVADGSGREMVYEAIGPTGREALVIQCISDNPNRTIQGIHKALERYRFRTAPVAFMFEKKGLIVVDPSKSTKSFDELFDVALEAGAEDVKETEGDDGPEWEVYVPLAETGSITQTLSSPPHDTDFAVVSSDLVYVPTDPLEITDDGMGISEDLAEGILSVAGALEEEVDVMKVWTNLA